MRTSSLLAVTLFLSTFRVASADFVIQPNDSLAIVGDSITAQHLYSADIEDYLLMCQPTQGLTVCQFGWGGEDARACAYRIPFDILPFKPTVVTTCYGMNDGRYTRLTDAIANTYRTEQTAVVEELKKGGVRTIIVGSPKPVDLYTYKGRDGVGAEEYNQNLAALAAIAKDVAAKEGVLYADVNGAFTAAAAQAKAQYGPAYNMGGDGVHPGPDGHLVMAYAFLKALGCDGNIGTITVDMGANQATGTPGQEIVSDQAGLVTVKSTRYPYCFAGVPDRPDATPAAMLRAVPFNEELNRYLLVVTNLTTPRAKITWGGTTKDYAAADLAKGINLAAEFVQSNPFMPQFTAVDNYVHIEEDQEQALTQELMFPVPRFKSFIAPGVDAQFDQIVAAGMSQHQKLFNSAAALVVPVTHTIKIEPEP
jgi:lysophospholipase L1-like esterase